MGWGIINYTFCSTLFSFQMVKGLMMIGNTFLDTPAHADCAVEATHIPHVLVHVCVCLMSLLGDSCSTASHPSRGQPRWH